MSLYIYNKLNQFKALKVILLQSLKIKIIFVHLVVFIPFENLTKYFTKLRISYNYTEDIY